LAPLLKLVQAIACSSTFIDTLDQLAIERSQQAVPGKLVKLELHSRVAQLVSIADTENGSGELLAFCRTRKLAATAQQRADPHRGTQQPPERQAASTPPVARTTRLHQSKAQNRTPAAATSSSERRNLGK